MKREGKTIEYKQAPTGNAYIGKYKEPLMSLKDGFGFVGVLLQSEDRTKVQCHLCGRWFKALFLHIKVHEITAREYKEKFGLNYTTGLLSDATAELKRQVYYQNIEACKLPGDSWKHANPKKDEPKRYSEERVNTHGTCALQLLTRTINFINANKTLPTSRNRGKNLYTVIHRKYGSVPGVFKKWGLPSYKIKGSNYTYIFPDKTKLDFNYLVSDERSKLYRIMKEKCPVLKAQDLEPYVVGFDK